MTLGQALSGEDLGATRSEICQDLTVLDGLIRVLILGNNEPFAGYTPDSDPETQLLAPPPFDEIYPHRLAAQAHYRNGETVRCNNANALFRAAWQRFADHRIRTDPPAKTGFWL